MPSIDSRIWLAGIGLAMLGTASAAHADVLVVRAIGPSAARYKPGTVLPDNATIVLKGSDSLTLLDAQGSWTLQGPVTTIAKVRARNAATAPKIMTVNNRRARVGAVRGVPGVDFPDSVYEIDVARGGAQCIADPATVLLWRKDSAAAMKMTVTGADGTATQVDWGPGQNVQPWPEALPVADGARYRFTFAAVPSDPSAPSPLAAAPLPEPMTLDFKLLATTPTSAAETGRALIQHACSPQLDLLVALSTPPGDS